MKITTNKYPKLLLTTITIEDENYLPTTDNTTTFRIEENDLICFLSNTKTMFKTHSGEWMLNIRNVKHSDAGNYECQVTQLSTPCILLLFLRSN